MKEYFDFGYLSIGSSIVLGIFCIGKIRSYDTFNKVPVPTLVLVAIYGGVVSMALALAGYKVADYFGFKAGWDWLWFLLFVGPLEEASKYCGLLVTSRFY